VRRFRRRQQACRKAARDLHVAPNVMKSPKPEERGNESHRIGDVLAEFACARIGPHDLRICKALRGRQRRTEHAVELQFALDALGLTTSDPRSPTQTGGLAHHGGPGNNYAMHGLANTVLNLRSGRGSVGFVSGLGMSATKHAVAVLSNAAKRSAASDGRATRLSLPPEEFAGPALVDAPSGPAQVESYTVMFDRDNKPERSVLYLRLPDGRRSVANGEPSAELFRLLLEVEGVGLRGTVSPGKGVAPNLFSLR